MVAEVKKEVIDAIKMKKHSQIHVELFKERPQLDTVSLRCVEVGQPEAPVGNCKQDEADSNPNQGFIDASFCLLGHTLL